MASDEEFSYSPFGYGTVVESTERKIVLKLVWGGTAYLCPEQVRRTVNFTVKSFSVARRELSFEWPVGKSFESLFAAVPKQLELPANSSIVLIHPKGSLKTIDRTDTPVSLNLKAGDRLVALAQFNSQVFSWNEAKKGANIQLSNQNMTAQKQNDENFETVLGNVALEKGEHYWEVKIDCFVDEEDIFIGVALENIPLTARPVDSGMFWGYLSSGAVKFAPDRECEDYGDTVATGDVIGVLLKYTESAGTISFSKNGNEFGVAFDDLPRKVCPAVCLLLSNSQVTLDFKH